MVGVGPIPGKDTVGKYAYPYGSDTGEEDLKKQEDIPFLAYLIVGSLHRPPCRAVRWAGVRWGQGGTIKKRINPLPVMVNLIKSQLVK